MNGPPNTTSSSWRYHRAVVSVAAHVLLFALSLLIAFALAYNFLINEPWLYRDYLPALAVVLLIKTPLFGVMGLYRDSWRYVGLRDLFSIIKASHVSFFIFMVLYYLYYRIWMLHLEPGRGMMIPSSVFPLDWVFTFGLIGAARVGFRFYYEELRPLSSVSTTRLLIIGAGDVGEMVLREIVRTSEDRYIVVGFLDDDETKRRARIRGIEVLGKTRDIRTICEEKNVDEVLIAMHAAPRRQVREMIELCYGMNLRFRTVPAVSDLIEGKVEVSQIRPVEIADLLGREPVTLDTAAIGEYINDKVVMVTGAGGSIGSEMCRQIALFKPKKLLLIERMENALFEMDRVLQREFPEISRVPYVADISDTVRIKEILNQDRPTAIFHAAAHKHVPMMEFNPGEAIKNNVLGTRCLADAASAAGVEKFVMISTDKAVNPTSIMGCTKRVAEMYVQQLSSHTDSRTEFVTVRFGNVLGSSGSVIPIFKDQIERGGPVTVTHPEMRRYFMTIPEAAQLVLQAGALGDGGEIFLLDMGEPVKIVDLAVDLITLSGLRPNEDIEIRFTGVRPGEKLFEELSITGEDMSRTAHPKIGIIRKRPEDFEQTCQGITVLSEIMNTARAEDVRHHLRTIVPEYTPSVIESSSASKSDQTARTLSDAEGDLPTTARIRPA